MNSVRFKVFGIQAPTVLDKTAAENVRMFGYQVITVRAFYFECVLLENNFGWKVSVRRGNIFAHCSHRIFQNKSSILIKGRTLLDLSNVSICPVLRCRWINCRFACRRMVRTVVVHLSHDASTNVDLLKQAMTSLKGMAEF